MSVPACKRYKLAKYETCQDCRKGGESPASRQRGSSKSPRRPTRYRREHSDAWAAGDAEANEFYVYILKLNDGSFYAGPNPGDQRAPDGASRRHDEVHCGARPSACVVRDGADARAGCGLRGPDQTRLRPESTGNTPLGPEIPGPRGGVELRLILVSEHACGETVASGSVWAEYTDRAAPTRTRCRPRTDP